MKKKFKILLIESKDKEEATLFKDSIYDKLVISIHPNSKIVSKIIYKDCDYFDLIIISDNEIKENDWFYNENTKSIFKSINKPNFEGEFKIISSSNSKLNLPLIPKSFIEYYISEYNKGNIIEEVGIEIDLIETGCFVIDGELEEQLKTNQQNEISIVIPEEKNFHYADNREEDKEIVLKLALLKLEYKLDDEFDNKLEKIGIKFATKLACDNAIKLSKENKYSKEEVKVLLDRLADKLIDFRNMGELNYEEWLKENLYN